MAINFLAGSVIFGGVMLTLTVVFFIKMKNGVPKYGFNRLPTTSGK